MLDRLFELIDENYSRNIHFMGLAFKFEKGITIIDRYFENDLVEGFKVEWVSFIEVEKPVSVICKDTAELHLLLKTLL